MLEIGYIMGLTIAITEILKINLNINKLYIWIPIMFLACGLNMLNAYLFADDCTLELLRNSGKEGIIIALQSSGIYALGKSVIEKSKEIKG